MLATPIHHAEWLYVRHVLLRIAATVAVSSILANLLPPAKLLKAHPVAHEIYDWLVGLIACLALNWRAELPSLDAEFLGFRSRWRRRFERKLERKRQRDEGNC